MTASSRLYYLVRYFTFPSHPDSICAIRSFEDVYRYMSCRRTKIPNHTDGIFWTCKVRSAQMASTVNCHSTVTSPNSKIRSGFSKSYYSYLHMGVVHEKRLLFQAPLSRNPLKAPQSSHNRQSSGKPSSLSRNPTDPLSHCSSRYITWFVESVSRKATSFPCALSRKEG